MNLYKKSVAVKAEKTPKYTGIRMFFKEGLEQLEELEKSDRSVSNIILY